jgi:Protein of unknown function (DUF1203)
MTYRIKGLAPEQFSHLLGASDEVLAASNAVRMAVDSKPGAPCRITLEDAEPGETVILVNHVSHDVANPYRASHAIFLRDTASQVSEYVDEIPPVFAPRVLSMRGFDDAGMMVDALITQPGDAEQGITTLFDNADIAYIHAHNAIHGCFAAKVERA